MQTFDWEVGKKKQKTNSTEKKSPLPHVAYSTILTFLLKGVESISVDGDVQIMTQINWLQRFG